jgi:hypothetical protein
LYRRLAGPWSRFGWARKNLAPAEIQIPDLAAAVIRYTVYAMSATPLQLTRKDKIGIVKHSISKLFLKRLPVSRNSDCSLLKVRGEFFTPKQIKISYNVFPEMSGFRVQLQ